MHRNRFFRRMSTTPNPNSENMKEGQQASRYARDLGSTTLKACATAVQHGAVPDLPCPVRIHSSEGLGHTQARSGYSVGDAKTASGL